VSYGILVIFATDLKISLLSIDDKKKHFDKKALASKLICIEMV
jgi:hypothetical protein